MVRCSERQAVLRRLEGISETAVKQAVIRRLMGLCAADLDCFLYECKALKDAVRSNRCLRPRLCRRRTPKFALYLRTDHDNYLTDREFLFHFRVSRDSFWQLVELLKDHPAFQRRSSDARGGDPRPASEQLLVLMKHYGCEGNAGSSINLGSFFGIASGAVDTYKETALEALLSLENRTHLWPDAEERRSMAIRIKENYYFPNCVGIIDGTLLPLHKRPLLHGENYMSRKRFYAIAMLVVCDDLCRITHYHVGWPGSAHDQRVWRTCDLNKHCQDYFSPNEYLLGDSAFTASDAMIPPFKTFSGTFLSQNEMAFNTLLSKPRVKSEHCIGIFKGRLPLFKGMRMLLGNKKHMDKIIKCVRGGVMLHNYLIEDTIDDSWLDGQEEGLDDLEPERIDKRSNKPDCRRRDELLHHLSLLEETTIN